MKKKWIIQAVVVLILLPMILPAYFSQILTLQSPNEGIDGYFGYSVSGIPDVDGDGRGDFIVGAYREDPLSGLDNSGRAYIFSGASGSLLQTLQSPNAEQNGYFGYSVSGIPDVDGDGLDDVIVGAYREDHVSFTDAGRAYVYSGASGVLLHTLEPPNAESSGWFGCSVSGTPDVDGDGQGDVIVGAHREDQGSFTDAGRAYVFSGASGNLLQTLESPNIEMGGNFGYSVSGITDVNDDSRGDVIVGTSEDPEFSPGGAGRAYIFSGESGSLLQTLQSPNEETNGFFGYSVSGIPDVDGDGRSDVIVGARYEDPGSSPDDTGRAYIFSGVGGALLHTLQSPNEEYQGYFGCSVSGIPDMDGDGRGDVIVGAYWEDPGSSPDSSGRAYVFSGASGALLHTLQSLNEETEGFFGYSVSGIADTNGDDMGDVIAGAYIESPGSSPDYAGRAYIFYGPPRVVSIVRAHENPTNRDTVEYAVRFSENMYGVDVSDFKLTTTGDITGTTVTKARLSFDNSWTVFVDTGSGNGTLRLDLMDDDSIRDYDYNKLGGPGAGNGDFTSGEVYTIDKTVPSITAGITLDNMTPTNRDVVAFSVDFDEPVGDSFHMNDILLTGSLAPGATVLVDGATTDSFTVLASPADPNTDGTLGISITGEVKDAAGNPLAVPVNSPLYTIRNHLGDKNDNGDVSAAELNEVILYFRDLLP